jgi:hypothetical protein
MIMGFNTRTTSLVCFLKNSIKNKYPIPGSKLFFIISIIHDYDFENKTSLQKPKTKDTFSIPSKANSKSLSMLVGQNNCLNLNLSILYELSNVSTIVTRNYYYYFECSILAQKGTFQSKQSPPLFSAWLVPNSSSFFILDLHVHVNAYVQAKKVLQRLERGRLLNYLIIHNMKTRAHLHFHIHVGG